MKCGSYFVDVMASCVQVEGFTPLFVAAQNGHDSTVTALLAHPNTDVNKAMV